MVEGVSVVCRLSMHGKSQILLVKEQARGRKSQQVNENLIVYSIKMLLF